MDNLESFAAQIFIRVADERIQALISMHDSMIALNRDKETATTAQQLAMRSEYDKAFGKHESARARFEAARAELAAVIARSGHVLKRD